MSRLVNAIAKAPNSIRFFLGPILWRAGVVAGTAVLVYRWPNLMPYDLSDPDADLSPMFYAISGVLGVVGGFLVAALTMIGTGSGQQMEYMRRQARFSLPLKMLYSIVSLLTLSMILALLGPYAGELYSMVALFSGLAIGGIEMISVSLIVFLALAPTTSDRLLNENLLDP